MSYKGASYGGCEGCRPVLYWNEPQVLRGLANALGSAASGGITHRLRTFRCEAEDGTILSVELKCDVWSG